MSDPAERDPHQPDAQGFIPFIHNYCDRWCEKCRFVRQCRVGVVDVDLIDEGNTEVAGEKVESYEDRLRKAMDMGEEEEETGDEGEAGPLRFARGDQAQHDMEEDETGDEGEVGPLRVARGDQQGQDMEEEDPEEKAEYEREQAELERRLEAHPLTIMGDTYLDMVQEWMEEHDEALKKKGLRLDQPPARRAIALSSDLLVLNEACEEVLWFCTMLPVKTHRAIHGKLEDPTFMEDIGLDPLQSDENGTAKLVLHFVDRCQAAWATIAEMMPEQADSIVPVQELLRRHAEAMRAEFPDAEKFIRPGFDAPGAR